MDAPVTGQPSQTTDYGECQDFFQYSSDLMCVANLEFRLLSVNPAFERTLGYTRAELCSRPYLDFVHPDDRQRTTEDRDVAFGPDGTLNFENRYIAKNGEVIWLSWSARPSKRQKGLTFAIARNITEQKRAEQALREGEERLRLITDNVPAIVAYVEADSLRYRFVNRFYATMLGLPPEKVIGQTIDTVMPPESFARALPFINRTRAGEEVSYDNLVPFQGIRHWFNVRYTPEFDVQGKVRNIIVMAVEITERKNAEEELDRRNSVLSALLENLPMGVFMVEAPSGKPIFANRTAMNLLGRGILPDTSERNLAEVYKAFRLPDKQPYPPQEMPVIIGMQGKSSHVDDMVVIRPDGRETTLEIFGSPVTDSHGNIWASLVSFWDITDRHRAATEKEQLEAQNRRLQKAESLGRMAGAIAHHFNNQLQAIFGNLDFALTELPPGAHDLTRFLNNALLASKRASQVSTLMLTYLGQGSSVRHLLDLAEICQQSLPFLTATMPKHVVIETDLPAPGPAINAAPDEIQQVFANLVTNAWEACSQSQSAIRISVSTIAADKISSGSRFPVDGAVSFPSYACLEVSDPGSGIAPEDLETIFDPFFTRKFTGRGMGLPVVLGIIRSHEGFITVTSAPDHGSTFRVHFPLAEGIPAPPPTAPFVATEIPATAQRTILVIDDEESVRNLTSTMLRKLGFKTFSAKDGVEGVELFLQHRQAISCVLCDLSMPRMNGWETLSALRRLVPDLPVILVSGYSEAQVMNGTHADQPQGFLSKPFSREKLGEIIIRVLGGKSR